jgi:hypothetical protein
MAKYIVDADQVSSIVEYWKNKNRIEAHLWANAGHEVIEKGWIHPTRVAVVDIPGRRPKIRCTITNRYDNGMRAMPRVRVVLSG